MIFMLQNWFWRVIFIIVFQGLVWIAIDWSIGFFKLGILSGEELSLDEFEVEMLGSWCSSRGRF